MISDVTMQPIGSKATVFLKYNLMQYTRISDDTIIVDFLGKQYKISIASRSISQDLTSDLVKFGFCKAAIYVLEEQIFDRKWPSSYRLFPHIGHIACC